VDFLPLPVIGWLFTIASALALVLGGWLIAVIHLRDEAARKELARRVLDDMTLFGVWILGMAGGVGVLLDKSWSRPVLELFCWVLMVLVTLSAISRWRAAPRPRGLLAVSLALFVLPVAAVCIATIVTLRGETALRVLSG